MVQDNSNNNNNSKLATSRHEILTLIESFVENILQVRKTVVGVSISALVLAPLAIALSVFLIQTPDFFAVLEIENEFGLVLSILLGAIIIISSLWLLAGVRQYRSISSWNRRYAEYIKNKEEMERKIVSSRQQNRELNNNNSYDDIRFDDSND
jgi:hypothetical protein